MKIELPKYFEIHRVKTGPYASNGMFSPDGAFIVQNPLATDTKSRWFTVIIGTGLGWDHVSVSLPHRTPRWEEMEWVKRSLFEPDEVAVQYHVAESDHINVHPNVLHIWRRQGFEMPLPPKEMV
jgi:hypothetical protein